MRGLLVPRERLGNEIKPGRVSITTIASKLKRTYLLVCGVGIRASRGSEFEQMVPGPATPHFELSDTPRRFGQFGEGDASSSTLKTPRNVASNLGMRFLIHAACAEIFRMLSVICRFPAATSVTDF